MSMVLFFDGDLWPAERLYQCPELRDRDRHRPLRVSQQHPDREIRRETYKKSAQRTAEWEIPRIVRWALVEALLAHGPTKGGANPEPVLSAPFFANSAAKDRPCETTSHEGPVAAPAILGRLAQLLHRRAVLDDGCSGSDSWCSGRTCLADPLATERRPRLLQRDPVGCPLTERFAGGSWELPFFNSMCSTKSW